MSEYISLTHQGQKRFGKIADVTREGVVGRTKLYEMAACHPGLFRKNGASTLVDLHMLDQLLNGLPVATIRRAGAKTDAPSSGSKV
jgi:hypothetical protein